MVRQDIKMAAPEMAILIISHWLRASLSELSSELDSLSVKRKESKIKYLPVND